MLPGYKDVYVVFLALFAHNQRRSVPLSSHQMCSNQTDLEINLTSSQRYYLDIIVTQINHA